MIHLLAGRNKILSYQTIISKQMRCHVDINIKWISTTLESTDLLYFPSTYFDNRIIQNNIPNLLDDFRNLDDF
jgi:hypothetical protein